MKHNVHVATLLLSAVLIGAPSLSGGAHAHEGWEQSGSGPGCEHEHLSEAKMKLLHETMIQLHQDNKEVREQIHKLHEERHDVLAAGAFDKEAFLAITAQIEKRHERLEQSRIHAFAAIADKFTPEERQRLARMFMHRHHGGLHHASWRKGDDHEGWHRHEGHDGGQRHEDHADDVNDNDQTNQTNGQRGYPPYSPR